jgi:hypothetical protein
VRWEGRFLLFPLVGLVFTKQFIEGYKWALNIISQAPNLSNWAINTLMEVNI